MRFTILILGIISSNLCEAGAYKCIDENGKTAYQSKPCANNQNAVEINFKTGAGIDKNTEQSQQAELQESKELEEIERQQKKQQLLIEAKIESETNQQLIKDNPDKYSAYAIPPYDPDNLSDVVKKFGARLNDVEKLRRLAAEKVLSTGQCTRVESSELNIKSTLEKLVILVDCSTGRGISLTEDELK
ncbi:MAG: DUF4124 domain-containing protein [Methylicorpusculum sp.]|uniref:DUF4124 domain-containing protein n=1 Tax=Methylicorpusculum sp. TaxID=2713644 RepID=UPI0027210556|nr:DUF4124 domain-containing protein [Methylicorpusculum sp.]MDO8938737.1 DUF4124 domain-containing protein [Methylicorpusculum sp.]MDP2201209.1 DUF4124 domain-containing protein [Methylicorpusculum sp.]